MAHKKQYFRIRCLASFAIMKQGGTPTHIVLFGHFGFTAKYKSTPYQNDTDNFFSWIPHDQNSGTCHCLSNVPQLRDGQTDILVFPCAPCRSVLCLSCYGGISPDRLHAFRPALPYTLVRPWSVVTESNRHKHTGATASLTALLAL